MGRKVTPAPLPPVSEMKKVVKWEKRLTTKQLQFIYNYVSNGGVAKKAAIDAGYPIASASMHADSLMHLPTVQRKLKQHMKYKLEAAEVTFDWKIQMLKDMIGKCISGEGLRDNSANPSGLIGCISELNKMQGHYAPDKHLVAHADIDLNQVEKLIKEYQKEY